MPPLARDSDADVVIVGAGFSGLWTAHHLATLDPSLDILVLDARQPGFGASGRNGGWCSAMFPVPLADLVRTHGHEAALAQRTALIGAVDAVGAFLREHSIDAGWTKGGRSEEHTSETPVTL